MLCGTRASCAVSEMACRSNRTPNCITPQSKCSSGTTRNTLRPPWKTSQGRQSCPWCRGVMETWCRWENARKGSSCGLDRIYSSDGAGTRWLYQLISDGAELPHDVEQILL